MNSTSHCFSFVWLAYSGNKFFRVGPNISEKFVPGETNFRGVQIKRDRPFHSLVSLIKYAKTECGRPDLFYLMNNINVFLGRQPHFLSSSKGSSAERMHST